jgi:hypothetical protein
MQNELKREAIQTNIDLEKKLLKNFISKVVERNNIKSKKLQSWNTQKSLIDSIAQNERKLCSIK